MTLTPEMMKAVCAAGSDEKAFPPAQSLAQTEAQTPAAGGPKSEAAPAKPS